MLCGNAGAMWHLPIMVLIASSALAVEPAASLSARILPAAQVSERDWLLSERRMERIVIDDQGRSLLLRTIEHE